MTNDIDSEQVTEKGHANITLADLAFPTDITRFNPRIGIDSIEIGVKVGGKREIIKRTLTAPIGFAHHPVCSALLNFMACNSEVPITNYNRCAYSNKFFNWLEESPNEAEGIGFDVFSRYNQYLVSIGISHNSASQYFSFFRGAINWGLSELFSEASNPEESIILRKTLARIPKLKRRSSKPSESLSQVATGVEIIDELELLKSCIRYCTAFLELTSRFRDELLASPEVRSALDAFLSESDSSADNLVWPGNFINRNLRYGAICRAVLTSESLALKELLVVNKPSHRESLQQRDTPMSAEELNSIIEDGLLKSGKIKPWDNISGVSFTNLDFHFLVHPCPAEESAVAWLLASDRVQQQGLNDLLLDDFQFSPSGVHVNYEKARSSEENKSTPKHHRSSKRYSIYERFVNLKKLMYERFPVSPPYAFSPRSTSFQTIDSYIWRPMLMGSRLNTNFGVELRNLTGDVNTFCALLRSIDENNSLIKRGKKPSGVSSQIITPQKIAQSRAILDSDDFDADSNESASSENVSADNFNRYSQDVVCAVATAHTPEVKERYYIHASETKYRVNKRANFAKAVGNLMVKEANKISNLKKRLQIVPIKKIAEELGIETSTESSDDINEFDRILSEAVQRGWSISPFGQLEKGDKIIIISSPIQAAMLITYIDACRAKLEQLTDEDAQRELAILLNAAYANSVLDNFDHKTKSAGIELLKNYSFPPPYVG
jgi:hypothetical protein